MQSKDEIYKKLHKEIDERMPINFPAHEVGLEIEILKLLFTPEEAAIATHLSALPEPFVRFINELQKVVSQYRRKDWKSY